jgi:hypothetical protein
MKLLNPTAKNYSQGFYRNLFYILSFVQFIMNF